MTGPGDATGQRRARSDLATACIDGTDYVLYPRTAFITAAEGEDIALEFLTRCAVSACQETFEGYALISYPNCEADNYTAEAVNAAPASLAGLWNMFCGPDACTLKEAAPYITLNYTEFWVKCTTDPGAIPDWNSGIPLFIAESACENKACVSLMEATKGSDAMPNCTTNGNFINGHFDVFDEVVAQWDELCEEDPSSDDSDTGTMATSNGLLLATILTLTF